jgi:hypothetical protein
MAEGKFVLAQEFGLALPSSKVGARRRKSGRLLTSTQCVPLYLFGHGRWPAAGRDGCLQVHKYPAFSTRVPLYPVPLLGNFGSMGLCR